MTREEAGGAARPWPPRLFSPSSGGGCCGAARLMQMPGTSNVCRKSQLTSAGGDVRFPGWGAQRESLSTMTPLPQAGAGSPGPRQAQLVNQLGGRKIHVGKCFGAGKTQTPSQNSPGVVCGTARAGWCSPDLLRAGEEAAARARREEGTDRRRAGPARMGCHPAFRNIAWSGSKADAARPVRPLRLGPVLSPPGATGPGSQHHGVALAWAWPPAWTRRTATQCRECEKGSVCAAKLATRGCCKCRRAQECSDALGNACLNSNTSNAWNSKEQGATWCDSSITHPKDQALPHPVTYDQEIIACTAPLLAEPLPYHMIHTRAACLMKQQSNVCLLKP